MEGIEQRNIITIHDSTLSRKLDYICVESPLSLSISVADEIFSLGLIMRTPGCDQYLIMGLLYSEGIISSENDILSIKIIEDKATVKLSDSIDFNVENHVRKSTMTSSCGICGKESISNLIHMHGPSLSENIFIDSHTVNVALRSLEKGQKLFSVTGGNHACGILDKFGKLKYLFEDVGRHNAMDKLIGYGLTNNDVPVKDDIVIVSGRASYELIQKSLRAGFSIFIALGAPSSLAVDLAKEHGMTLIGFAKKNKITIYSGTRRIKNKTQD